MVLPKTGCTSAKLKPCRFGSALGLHCFSSLELSHEPQCKPKAEGKFYLHSAEAKPALAAKQQQYAPSFSLSAPCILLTLTHSFSLSAPCILLTLTHRLRFVSNPYFDTPSGTQPAIGSRPNFPQTLPRQLRQTNLDVF